MRLNTISLLVVLCLLSLGNFCNPGSGGGGTSSNSNLSHIPEFDIQLTGPDKITNGTSGTFTATVKYKQAGQSADPPSITDKVELYGSNLAPPPFNAALGSTNLTIAIGATSGPQVFTVSCSPAGTKGTLGSSNHGSRVCASTPAIPCPPGCSKTPLGCPKGCGSPVVACVDDGVKVKATFHGKESAQITVLCMPSTGPTTGTF
jgi:hypothetical protein